MKLSQAIRGIIEELSAKELKALLTAVGRSEANKREFLRLARISNAGYSGKGTINLSQGNITDMRWETSSEALSRLLDTKPEEEDK